MTVLAAALAYAAHGWPVLPLLGPARTVHKAGKRPWLEDWQHSASTDPDAIAGWWRARPDSNVGLLTGARSGLVVLDVDPAAGGLDSLRQLQAGARLPRTLYARTGSGGWHLLYAHPGGPVPNSAGRLGPGLDVRGDGGQIVAAPSVHPATGEPYTWCGDWQVPLTPLPDVLRPTVERRPAAPVVTVTASRAERRLQALVRQVTGAPQGQGNAVLHWAACRAGELLAACVLEREQVAAALQAAGEARGRPADEVRATVRSASVSPGGSPWVREDAVGVVGRLAGAGGCPGRSRSTSVAL